MERFRLLLLAPKLDVDVLVRLKLAPVGRMRLEMLDDDVLLEAELAGSALPSSRLFLNGRQFMSDDVTPELVTFFSALDGAAGRAGARKLDALVTPRSGVAPVSGVDT